MKIYQVPVCIYCKDQADWDNDMGWWCPKDKKWLKSTEVEWIECIPLFAKDEK